jgi:hypothetical protein
MGALTGQKTGAGFADSAAGASNDNHFALNVGHEFFLDLEAGTSRMGTLRQVQIRDASMGFVSRFLLGSCTIL